MKKPSTWFIGVLFCIVGFQQWRIAKSEEDLKWVRGVVEDGDCIMTRSDLMTTRSKVSVIEGDLGQCGKALVVAAGASSALGKQIDALKNRLDTVEEDIRLLRLEGISHGLKLDGLPFIKSNVQSISGRVTVLERKEAAEDFSESLGRSRQSR